MDLSAGKMFEPYDLGESMSVSNHFTFKVPDGWIYVALNESGLDWEGEILGPAGGPYGIGAQTLEAYQEAGPLHVLDEEQRKTLDAAVAGQVEARPRGFVAIKAWTRELVEQLLASGEGADVEKRDAFGATPLLASAQNGWEVCIETLLARGADPNRPIRGSYRTGPKARTALHYAAQNHQLGAIRALAAGGANLNATDATLSTPLIVAATSYPDATRSETIELLLRLGADPNSQTRRKIAAIWWAIERNDSDSVGLLLGNGASPDVTDSYGWTPLMRAVFRPALVEQLLQAGASLEPVDKEGRSALHHAAQNRSIAVARILMVAGCDVGRTDHKDMTPADYARLGGNQELVALFEVGAKARPTASSSRLPEN